MEKTETIIVQLGKKEGDAELAKHWRKLMRQQQSIGKAKVDAFRALLERDMASESK